MLTVCNTQHVLRCW